jgi:Holliday junction resolvase RusA-like endonuclease
MEYTWYEPNRKRDKDNIAFAKKFCQDALVKSGTLANDGWAEIDGFTDTFEVDKRRPRVEVKIIPIMGDEK